MDKPKYFQATANIVGEEVRKALEATYKQGRKDELDFQRYVQMIIQKENVQLREVLEKIKDNTFYDRSELSDIAKQALMQKLNVSESHD